MINFLDAKILKKKAARPTIAPFCDTGKTLAGRHTTPECPQGRPIPYFAKALPFKMAEFLIVTSANLNRAIDEHPQSIPGRKAGGMFPDLFPFRKAKGKSINVVGDTLRLKRRPDLSQLLQTEFFFLRGQGIIINLTPPRYKLGQPDAGAVVLHGEIGERSNGSVVIPVDDLVEFHQWNQ